MFIFDMKIEKKNVKIKNNIEIRFKVNFLLKFIENELLFIILDRRALTLDFILLNFPFVKKKLKSWNSFWIDFTLLCNN